MNGIKKLENEQIYSLQLKLTLLLGLWNIQIMAKIMLEFQNDILYGMRKIGFLLWMDLELTAGCDKVE